MTVTINNNVTATVTVQVGSEDDGSHARVARTPLGAARPALESLLDQEVADHVLRRGEAAPSRRVFYIYASFMRADCYRKSCVLCCAVKTRSRRTGKNDISQRVR